MDSTPTLSAPRQRQKTCRSPNARHYTRPRTLGVLTYSRTGCIRTRNHSSVTASHNRFSQASQRYVRKQQRGQPSWSNHKLRNRMSHASHNIAKSHAAAQPRLCLPRKSPESYACRKPNCVVGRSKLPLMAGDSLTPPIAFRHTPSEGSASGDE